MHENRRNFRPRKLALLSLAEWDQEKAYDEQPANCLQYSIEWKVCVNGRMIAKDTEPNLVLAPSPYWRLFLQVRLEKLLRKNVPPNRSVRCDDTNVVVSVTDRSERDLTKRFEETEIDWDIVEKQLGHGANIFRQARNSGLICLSTMSK